MFGQSLKIFKLHECQLVSKDAFQAFFGVWEDFGTLDFYEPQTCADPNYTTLISETTGVNKFQY